MRDVAFTETEWEALCRLWGWLQGFDDPYGRPVDRYPLKHAFHLIQHAPRRKPKEER